MCKVMIFGGTTEGRLLAEYCGKNRIPAYVGVVSEYGRGLLKENQYIRPVMGPMDAEQMINFLTAKKIELVIDATHPYARKATENIKEACRKTKTRYLRCARNTESSRETAENITFQTPAEAAAWLEKSEGNIFITTGSNELREFAENDRLRERIYARVLPSSPVVKKCEEMGINGKHLICMQGPFSKEVNAALLRQTDAAFLVTKETGKAGGFDEKLEAAAECGVRAVIIGHPEETGETMESLFKALSRLSLSRLSIMGTSRERRRVILAGIGPGAVSLMTEEVKEAIKKSDFLLGAPRMLETAKALLGRENPSGTIPEARAVYLEHEVLEALRGNPGWQQAVILYSGDSGFYSGTKKLAGCLQEEAYEFSVLPGISSISYFASRLKISWDDALLETAHGREFDAVSALRAGERKIFLLTGGANSAGAICRSLAVNGFGHAGVTVGERLSYPDERITSGTAVSLSGKEFEPLSIILIEADVLMQDAAMGQDTAMGQDAAIGQGAAIKQDAAMGQDTAMGQDAAIKQDAAIGQGAAKWAECGLTGVEEK